MPSHATALRAAQPSLTSISLDGAIVKLGTLLSQRTTWRGSAGRWRARVACRPLAPAFVRHLPARLRQLPASAAVFCQGYGLDPDPPRPGRLPGPAPPDLHDLQLRITVLHLAAPPGCAPCFCLRRASLGSPASFAGQAFATQATAPPGSSVFPLIRASPASQAPLGVVLDASLTG